MLCDERSRQSPAVLDENGNLISSKGELKPRWTEHFKEVLNREAPANSITDDQENDVRDTLEEIAANEPTLGSDRERDYRMGKYWELTP